MFVSERAEMMGKGAQGKAAEAVPSELPLELIERQIEELAAHINAGSARWIELIGEFDRREGWANTGCRSTAEWVAWRCALGSRSARDHVRVARALRELPLIGEAFAAGALSYSKVRALTRVADPESEADLLELARHATAAQLERMVRAAHRASRREADEVHRASYLRWFWNDDDATLHLEAKLPAEEGAAFLRAIDAARDSLYAERRAELEEEAEEALATEQPQGGSAEPPAPRPPAPTNLECLSALAEVALARAPSGLNGLQGGERYELMVHVDAETLATDSPGPQLHGPGCCSVDRGPGIAAETARRIACDASLVGVIERDGDPLHLGRRTRAVSPATRRALIARDGHCQFPGCERYRFVDAHHIVHWARGGATDLENLVLLCRHHHRQVHEGGFSVRRDAGGALRFFAPDGSLLPASPSPPSSDPVQLPAANRARGLAIDRETVLTGSGAKMDLRLCVDAVLTAIFGRDTLRLEAPARVPLRR
jgi:hypothetical protein